MSAPKTVLITGASSGFGKATAELLAAKGYKLILIARRLERLKKLKESLKTEVFVAAVDVTDKNQVERFYASLPKTFLPVDVLINSAGLALGMGPAQESSLDDWDRMVDTNIKGLLYVTKAVIGDMYKRKHGLIINLGSVAGTLPYRGGNVYGATKAFLYGNSQETYAPTCSVRASKCPTSSPVRLRLNSRSSGSMTKQKQSSITMVFEHFVQKDIAATILWVIRTAGTC